ncbi:TPA: hypothetical protein ACF3RY_007185, partial [Pseudomonas aeruginosa]
MPVIGIEKLEFGVEDIPNCQKFLHDFGLQVTAVNPSLFSTLSGAKIQLFDHQDPTLPPAFETGSTLRRITWGTENATELNKIIENIQGCDGFKLTGDGAECRDPNGMTVAFTVTQQQSVEIEISPINQW